MLTCVQMPVPQAAATVTANALSFVFDIPAAIKGYNDAVDEVFGEVGSALAQFQIYSEMDRVDRELIDQIQKVMVSFVKLCAHVVKYHQGSKGLRILQQVRSIFDDDAGLAAERKVFQDALKRQHDVEGTLTLAAVSKMLQDVLDLRAGQLVFCKIADDTHQAVSALKENTDTMQRLIQIREALDVTPMVRLDSKTTQICTYLYGQRVANTGDWIWTHPAYGAWTESGTGTGTGPEGPEKQAAHVLVLSGPPSSGKSLAAAAITKRLEDQKGRAYVAHYFFPAGTHKSDDDKNDKNDKDDKNPVQTALKYMAFQLARVDPVVRSTLCKADSSAFRRGPDGLKGLWRALKIGAVPSGATYTLVMDGLENLPAAQANALLDLMLGRQEDGGPSGSSQRVRVLVSMTDDVWKEYCKDRNVNKAVFMQLQMQHGNQADMRLYIEDVLKNRSLLSHSSARSAARANSDQDRAREAILEALPEKTQGSYSRLQLELDAVVRLLLSARSDLGALEQQLQASTKTDGGTVAAAVQSLQRVLDAAEVAELNELLVWVLHAGWQLNVDELKAAMVRYV